MAEDLWSGFADFRFHLAIVEARCEFLGILRVFCGAEDVSVFVHRDRVTTRQGGCGVQGAENGGMPGEDRFFVLQFGFGAVLEGVAAAGEAAGEFRDFQIRPMTCENAGGGISTCRGSVAFPSSTFRGWRTPNLCR